MLIRKRAVKDYLQEKGKDTSESLYPALQGKVREILDKAVRASGNFKRVEGKDII